MKITSKEDILTLHERAYMAKLYADGRSYKWLANYFEVTPTRVYQILDKIGVIRKRRAIAA